MTSGKPAGGPAQNLSVSATHQYGGGISDLDVEAMAIEAGQHSVQDPEVWGANAEPVRGVELINATHGVNVHLIGHVMREAVLKVFRELDGAVPKARAAEQDALDAISEKVAAVVELERWRKIIREAGLALPHWIAHSLMYAAFLALVVVGDLAFIAVTFQLFGLSDEKIAGLPFSDELHIAASTAVFALLGLAHVAGERIATIKSREEGSPPRRFDVVVAALSLLSGVSILLGVSIIRASYLEEKDVDAQTLPFLAIQAGIFAAAVMVSIARAHPYGREWIDTKRRVGAAARNVKKACSIHGGLVACVNALIDEGNAIIAQAGHHFGASRADAIRQGILHVRRDQLSQPEPVSGARLYPQVLPVPPELTKAEVGEFLIGITGLPEIARMDTEKVIAALEEARRRIAELREEKAGPAEGGKTTITVDLPSAEDVESNGQVVK